MCVQTAAKISSVETVSYNSLPLYRRKTISHHVYLQTQYLELIYWLRIKISYITQVTV